MVTNLCPNSGNPLCPAVGEKNTYGYGFHFDIWAQDGTMPFGDNPVVMFQPVTCPGEIATDFQSCQCSGHLAVDKTPVGLQ